MVVNYRVIAYQSRYIFALCIIAFVMLYARRAVYTFIKPVKYTISCDIHTSSEIKKAIKVYLDTYIWKDIHTCVQDLHKTFSSISSVEIALYPSSVADIQIETKEPRFIINDNFVLTYQFCFISKKFFFF